jgi:hypothetical protein
MARMGKRIAAILFIFVCTTAAWALLGSTILYRTYEADRALRGRVASTWGSHHLQQAPTASHEKRVTTMSETQEDGKRILRPVEQRMETQLPLLRSRVNVALHLDHRQKGLLWYSTYKVAFRGEYTFHNDSSEGREVRFVLAFPTATAVYDDLAFTLDGRRLDTTSDGKRAHASAHLAPGARAVLGVGYRSQGLDRWGYSFGGNEVVQVSDFQLQASTDFDGFDFPENTLSPTEKRKTADGWELAWNYNHVVTGYQIGLVMPEKLQPGPLAGRISFFAPVSLFFFFFLMWIITTLRGIELHPMNYFFLAAAFFAFHLLLAYLVDHISIHAAFAICSAVSIGLVVSYLRLVVGIRFAAVEAGAAQFIYLVLFSYAFFFKGYTGLAVTIGSILTLFAVMQMTGRIRWAEKFAAKSA